MARKWTATLTRPVEIQVTFESTDVQTGNKVGRYSVPHTIKAGARAFKTKREALEWVELLNNEHGAGTAHMGAPS